MTTEVPGYVSKTDLVAALVRELVITGELEPGEQLRQRDLAQRFHVSQTPVREAMRRLESEGLLTCDTHRGFTVVAPARFKGAAMAAIVTDDGVTLHAEEAGQGEPLLFVHEFAGDHRSWEPQMRFFSAAYRCVTYAARGYPPSDVPTDPAAYSQERAVADAIAVLDGLEIGRAHVVGLSMGGFTALHLALKHPERIGSAVVAGPATAPSPSAPKPSVPSPCSPRPRSRPRAPRRLPFGTRSGRPGFSSRTRTRAAGPSSPRRWPATPHWAAP